MIRVLLVDDHPVVLAGLSTLLTKEDSICLVAEAANGAEAIALFRQHRPDVVLMDMRLPDMDGIAIIEAIKRLDSAAGILVLSTFGSQQDVAAAIAAGAKGYLLKGASRGELLQAVSRVSQGILTLPRELASHLAEGISALSPTQREMEVLRLIAQGHTNDEIARTTGVALSTVKSHINNLLSKLQARDRTQALVIAFKRGLIHHS